MRAVLAAGLIALSFAASAGDRTFVNAKAIADRPYLYIGKRILVCDVMEFPSGTEASMSIVPGGILFQYFGKRSGT